MAIDPMEALGAWGQITADQQAKLIDLTMAACMVKNGESRAHISKDDLLNVVNNYTVTRTPDETGWTITVRPKNRDPQLPLDGK